MCALEKNYSGFRPANWSSDGGIKHEYPDLKEQILFLPGFAELSRMW